MPKYEYRHVVTGITATLDESFAALFPGAFERIESEADEVAPATPVVEPAPAVTKKPNSSKEGNN